MSFAYPRTVSFRRPGADLAAGVRPYGVLDPVEETVLASGIAAAVRDRGPGRPPAAGTPDARSGRGRWRILTAPGSVDPAAQIAENDVVQDDMGRRFQVVQADTNGFGGWQISGELLRA